MKTPMKILSLLGISIVLAACSLPSWNTYTNHAYSFLLQYPAAGTIAPGATDTAIRIQLPITPGTNLAEKYLDISVQTGVATCESPLAAGYAPGTLTPTTLVINGLTWTKESAGEGAAGSQYDWTAYSTVSGIVCVSLTFVLHSHPPELFPTPPPVYDASTESGVFILIVDTFQWLKGGATTPTPGLIIPLLAAPATATPPVTATPVPTLTYTPTSSGFFFVPHLNAFCRLGPDPIFESIGLAMKGQMYPIDGRNEENTYFLIFLSKNVECWVLESTGEASGDLTKLRVLLPIPTPTFTPPPTATPLQLACARATTKDACLAIPGCVWAVGLNNNKGSCGQK